VVLKTLSFRFRSFVIRSTNSHPIVAAFATMGLLTFVLYGRALFAGFAPYDDMLQIVSNPAIASVSVSLSTFQHAYFFTSDLRSSGDSFYRPLFWLSLAIDRSLWNLSAVGFHFTNLVLHWFNAFLLFLLMRRLRFRYGRSLFASLLWLSLPVHSESVAWISGRAYCLSTFFILVGLSCAIEHLFARVVKKQVITFGLYMSAASLALLSHEAGFLLLPLTLLILVYYRQSLAASSVRLYAGSAVVDLVVVLVRHQIGSAIPASPGVIAPFGTFLLRYVSWMLIPMHMSFERSSDTPDPGWTVLAFSTWVLIAVLGVVVFQRKNRRLQFGVLWLVVCLLPYSGLTVLYQGMAERFTYLASMGIVLVACSLRRPRIGFPRQIVYATLTCWTCWAVLRLEGRISAWSNAELLYRDSLIATPRSYKLQYGLGALLEQDGHFDEAISSYETSLVLNRDYEPAVAGMGNAYLQLNDNEFAKNWYEHALALNRDDVKTVINYGTALQKLGRRNDAKIQYLRAIALAPSNASPYCDLAIVYLGVGQTKVAELLLQKAISVAPKDTTAYSDLAAIYVSSGQPDRALPLFRKVIELDPSDQTAIAGIRGILKL
jgi:tetratricopeptide (TPR) repeat protein